MNATFEIYAATILSNLYSAFPKIVDPIKSDSTAALFEETASQEKKDLDEKIKTINVKIFDLENKSNSAYLIKLIADRQGNAVKPYAEELQNDARHCDKIIPEIEKELFNLKLEKEDILKQIDSYKNDQRETYEGTLAHLEHLGFVLKNASGYQLTLDGLKKLEQPYEQEGRPDHEGGTKGSTFISKLKFYSSSTMRTTKDPALSALFSYLLPVAFATAGIKL